MKRNWLTAVVMTMALWAAGPAASTASAQATPQTPSQTPAYTTAERDMYVNAANEKDATQRVKLLDDFFAKYPNSTLLPYVYRDYFVAYAGLRNNLKVMENADKLLAVGDKVDALQGLESARLQAYVVRAQVFFPALNQRQLTTNEQFTAARSSAAEGLKFLAQVKKPEGVTDEQFKQQTDALRVLFDSVIGFAARQVKDYKGAIDAFQAALAISPNDAATYYQLGLSYLQQDPPQQQDGFWAIARAIGLKVQGEAQVRTYLKNQLTRFQNPLCDTLVDTQLNELITLAAGAAARPANYSVPSRADLDKALQEHGTIDSILTNLKAGGDTAKITWLAACGAEFPELGGKVFEATAADDSVVLKVFTAANEEAISAGTEPNIEVHVAGEPRAKLLKKDDLIAFSAALKSYTPEPFLLVVDKAKIREDTLPADEKPGKAPPKKAPAKRPPTKKPPL